MADMAWAQPKDKEEIVEFIDYVFSKAHRPHDFATLLPKLYGRDGDGAEHHFVIRENGKIMATILAYPVAMQMGGVQLLSLGIGSVSTHPAARGRGYMQALLGAVDERARAMNADFAVLSGMRQRYAYFDYHYGGYQMNAGLTPTNVRHVLAGVDVSGIEILPMAQSHAAQAAALQRRQSCFCVRSESAYLDILRSWENKPFVLMKGGAAAGFGTLRQNAGSCHIAELLLEDEADFPAAMKALSARQGMLTICAAPWEKARAAWLGSVCEEFSIARNHSYKVYREEHVREACRLMDGSEGALAFCGFDLPLPLYVAPPDAV